SWYKYAIGYNQRVKEFLNNDRKLNLNSAKTIAYKEIINHLSYVSIDALKKRTQRAFVIYDLFKAIGVDKIERIKSYTANQIA
ncbi:2121_t:CDS:1, partial [Racocetra fulgida]